MFGGELGRRMLSAKIGKHPGGVAQWLLGHSADMPRDSPIQGSLRRLPGMEAVELMVMESEHHKLPVLRAECAAVKVVTAKSANAGGATQRLRVNTPSAKASRFIIASLNACTKNYVPRALNAF